MVCERFHILTLPGLSALFICSLGSNFDPFVMHHTDVTKIQDFNSSTITS